MLTEKDLLRVYALLEKGMVEEDCGTKCDAFCCTGATTKYLLPGEEIYFRRHHPDVPVVEKPWYTQVFQSECCCKRQHRMFACRAFPFRPVLHRSSRRIVSLAKVDKALFEPCWIIQPDRDWAGRAVEAWEIVLDDADNRRHFGRIQFLVGLLDRLGDDYYQIPADSIEQFLSGEIAKVPEEELQDLIFDFFPTV